MQFKLLVALDIARAMEYLQECDPPIIHRDLRSPNVFLVDLGEELDRPHAKVADFGLSRAAGMNLEVPLQPD